MRKGPAQVHMHTAPVFQIDGRGVGVLGMTRVGAAEPGFPLPVHLAAALFGDAHIAAGGGVVLVSAFPFAIVVILIHLVVLLELAVGAFVRHIRHHAPQRAVRAPCHGRELRHRRILFESRAVDALLILHPAEV